MEHGQNVTFSQVVSKRKLTDKERAAGIKSDRTGYLGGCEKSSPP